jgi:hypothetical protein
MISLSEDSKYVSLFYNKEPDRVEGGPSTLDQAPGVYSTYRIPSWVIPLPTKSASGKPSEDRAKIRTLPDPRKTKP